MLAQLQGQLSATMRPAQCECVAICADGNHVVVGDHDSSFLTVFSLNGAVVRHIGKGVLSGGRKDVLVTVGGEYVVADHNNHRVCVFSADGQQLLHTWGSTTASSSVDHVPGAQHSDRRSPSRVASAAPSQRPRDARSSVSVGSGQLQALMRKPQTGACEVCTSEVIAGYCSVCGYVMTSARGSNSAEPSAAAPSELHLSCALAVCGKQLFVMDMLAPVIRVFE